MKTTSTLRLALVISGVVVALPGCSAIDRLASVGEAPPLSAIESPTEQPGYRPVRMPMPTPVAAVHAPNSLWRSGARAFFKDQRAKRVGDIVTVQVKIKDKAALDNKTTRTRNNSEAAGYDALAGYAKRLHKYLPEGVDPSRIADLTSTSTSEGSGQIDREEDIETVVAAIVTQVLPNGNLVIEGRQEIRVNFEKRVLIVAGVVRPEDITAQNTIDSSKIAESRISYGGRGQITDVQQPRYGQQVLDILLPF